MQKEYKLQGLDCANCAAKIEKGIKSINGVTDVVMNFMSGTLKLDTSPGYGGDILADVKKTVHKYEPDVVVTEVNAKDIQDDAEDDGGKLKIVQLVIGAALFAAGIALNIGEGVNLFLIVLSYVILGRKVIFSAFKNILRGRVFDENFLMSTATIGAFAIGEYPEAAAVMLFYQIGEYFQSAAVAKSRKSIAGLMDLRPDYANIERNGEIIRVSPEKVCIGDIIIVKPGESIPLDGVVTEGVSSLDTKALTGESLPRDVKEKDAVISGCVNLTGLISVKVTKTYGESTVAKIIDLVENASSKKAPTESFITTFSKYYTPAVVALAVLIAVAPPVLTGGDWLSWFNRGLVFLVISCPCALVISIPMSFFGGIGASSRRGILVKGGSYLEALNSLDIVAFDKTGTLTKGVFEVTDICPANGFTEQEVLEAAAYAESFSNHPIALSVLRAFDEKVDKGLLSKLKETPGFGVSVMVGEKHILAGNAKLMETEEIGFEEVDKVGTKIYVAIDGRFAGCIVIADEIKPDSRETIKGLKQEGVRKTVMLTGDNNAVAAAVAEELQLDEVYAQLLPAQKAEKLESMNREKLPKGKLAFVGDGINDAPVLAMADIGIAMGGLGSDAAIESADIVLMTDEPSKLLEAISIAGFTKRIVWQNIIFALGIKGAILLLGAFGAAGMWEAVFADVGVSVLAILNALRIFRKYRP